jgi:sialic acid synthase SpsE
VAAVALGARVIEKHICLSRDMEGPDSKFSTEPSEFAEMVHAAREAFVMRGDIRYELTENEKASAVFRRSIFAVDDIYPGDVFTDKNIRIIRPAHGLKPKYYDTLMGSVCKGQYSGGMPLRETEGEGGQ